MEREESETGDDGGENLIGIHKKGVYEIREEQS